MLTARVRAAAEAYSKLAPLVAVTVFSIVAFVAVSPGRVYAADSEIVDPAEEYTTPATFAGDLRTLPQVWPAGHADDELAVLSSPAESQFAEGLQQNAVRATDVPRAAVTFAPFTSFAGQQFIPAMPDGAVPPDTVGDVGPDYYVQAVNYEVTSPSCTNPQGTLIAIYNKSGTLVSGPTILSSLWPAASCTGGVPEPCRTGHGDPIVLYDQLAGRWLISEIPVTRFHMCVYVSRTSNPITGGWYLYSIDLVDHSADFQKWSVWPDAYYVGTNDGSLPDVYAFQRSKMLSGQPAAKQRQSATALSGFFFQILPPTDLDGMALPAYGSPGIFIRHRDDEIHNATPDAAHDFLEIWEFHVDWSPGFPGTTFTNTASIPVAEFDSTVCGLDPNAPCFLQPPGAPTKLRPQREVMMWRLQYRNLGPYESIVGNFVVDTNGADHGGIRWFELRRTKPGTWSLFQEGTWNPDASDRWLGSIATDRSGNIALGYSKVNSASTIYPSIAHVGRASTDTPGSMTSGEVVSWSGSTYSSDGRWGDYSSMNVDPVDECTFWYTNEYARSDHRWATRIAKFRLDSPTCVDALPSTCGSNCIRVDSRADSYTTSNLLGTNYGSSTTLNVGRNIATKGSSTPSVQRTFVGFDLTVALPDNATVTQAILHMNNYSTFGTPPDPTPNAAVYRSNDDGTPDELGINAGNQPPAASSPAPVLWSLAITSAPAWVTLNVTTLATDCWNNRSGLCSWQIQWINEEDNTAAGAYFISREDSGISAPYLDVTYTVP